MATNTTNYGWTKPDYEDDADIAVLNETFDAIDEQVKTNENNISSVQEQANWNSNNGVKNIITGGEKSTTRNNVTFTVNADSSITVKTGTGGASGSDATFFKVSTNTVMSAGTWVLSGGHNASCRLQDANNNWQSGAEATEKTFSTDTTYSIFIRVQPGWSNTTGVTLYPMITLKSLYDADPTYQPYAMSNAELTAAIQALQAQLANQ